MFECPGLKPGDGGRFHVCERTNLLFVEFNTVSCSSRSAMEAGPRTGKGCSAPWMYHRVAGQYTLFEKQLVSDFSPRPRRPSPRVLRDSTNWHDAPPLPPPPWGPLRSEGPCWTAEPESKRAAAAAASPEPRVPRSPTADGWAALRRRELAWVAAVAAAARPPTAEAPPGEAATAAPQDRRRQGGPLGGLGQARGEWPARSPPSYEAHMLLRAGQGPRKENCPRPPPYVAPPSYEAAHRTARPPQPRGARAARASAAAGGKAASLAGAPPSRPEAACEGGPRAPSAERRRGPSQAAAPGRWSYLEGARTWGGRRRPPERAEASPFSGWPRTPPPRSHTLPRAAKGPLPASRPMPAAPQYAPPVGWGFGRAAGKGGRASPAGAGATPRRAGPGGLVVIDATCVVIQTHYIPPARTERVRYVGPSPAAPSPSRPTAPPPSGSLEERAARILGLPVSELGFAGQGEQPSAAGPAGSPEGRRADGGGPAQAVAGAAPEPVRAPSAAPDNPQQPFPNPAPAGALAEPPGAGPAWLEAGRELGQGGDGCAPLAEAEPSCSPRRPRSYVRDLREAMSRIRRHTAPDSDTDEELEKERRPARRHLPWQGRLAAGAPSCSSSSSESLASNATVVPGSARSTPLSNGPQGGWQPSQAGP